MSASLESATPLLSTTDTESNVENATPVRQTRWGLVAGVIAIPFLVAGAGGFAAKNHSTVMSLRSEGMGLVGKASEWQMYKVTISIIPGTGEAVKEFWSSYVAPAVSDLPSSLGCSSTRNAVNLYNQQMHFVDAKLMEREGHSTTYWYQYFQELNGDMTKFNVHEHNKVVMYVPTVKGHIAKLNKDSVDFMKRISLDSTGMEVAHVGLNIEGRVYELVAPAADLDPPVRSTFKYWSDEECSEAHELQETLEAYKEKYYELKEIMDEVATDDEVENFDFDVPMIVRVSIATDDFTKQNDLAHLHMFTGAHIGNDISVSDTCMLKHVSWSYKNEGKWAFKLPPVTYVKNTHPSVTVGKHSVGDFLDYLWDDQHIKFAAAYRENWGDNWDHWLDTHIGMQVTAETTKDRQWQYHDLIYDELSKNRWPVGYRHGKQSGESGNDFHFYTGYRNTYAWEWLINEGHYKSKEFNLCGCIAENNAKIYYEDMLREHGKKEALGLEESECGWYPGESGAK